MPEFSACYFCGTALDAPLSEYPVVPDALDPPADQQRTVVLCPTCRRKLGAVVETVLEAVEDAPDEASTQASLGEGSAAGTPVEPDDGGFEFADESSAEAGATTSDEVVDELDREETDEVIDETTAGEDRPDDVSEADGPAAEAGDTEDDGADDDGADEDGADENGAASEAVDDAPSESSDASTAEAESSEPDAGSSSADDASSTTDAESSEADASPPADDPQLTALEYNKVMRLLQNREFPVDREEFKIVATNAYEIGEDEYDAVIEAAAKRDLIGLEGGQIVES